MYPSTRVPVSLPERRTSPQWKNSGKAEQPTFTDSPQQVGATRQKRIKRLLRGFLFPFQLVFFDCLQQRVALEVFPLCVCTRTHETQPCTMSGTSGGGVGSNINEGTSAHFTETLWIGDVNGANHPHNSSGSH